ncbi:hypothetical protein CLV24_109133 [Pontibacter ummariensis]|uniref:Uncharacterized protein n=1 Tax=Pontibacter ummariensis TaxID=1610492 RepID=A0A239FM28_9BACT|nr:hypothetical protein [Pontibacter ummariensis]PRY12008.1 hypothetical protein CLV24_109133 [Pontibacter ummariensis]SNS58006.1 hypothetical protein SAMN06296052_10937 [Pontibacter ummariensis]
MLYTQKETQDYDTYAEQIVHYAERSGFEDIKADFNGYDSPASLTMVNRGLKLTPDFTAKRGDNKYYFELVVKDKDEEDQSRLVSKWKALESIAKMKGGKLRLFVPHGSYKYAADLIQSHDIDAQLMKMSDL